MPEKRGEVVEKVDASQMMPDVYEIWLRKQETKRVTARPGFIGKEEKVLDEEEGEDRQENEIDNAESAHEKAKRRKRALKGH